VLIKLLIIRLPGGIKLVSDKIDAQISR